MIRKFYKRKFKKKKEEARIEEKTNNSKTELLLNIDDILDEIDNVLEENATEFINSYRQYGGQ